MFTRHKIDSTLDAEIIAALEELEKVRDDPEKYATALDRVAKLKELKPPSRLKPFTLDTALVVGANIFGILYLARFDESASVMKKPTAFRFIVKPRSPAV